MGKFEVEDQSDRHHQNCNDATDHPFIPVHSFRHGWKDLPAFANVIIHPMQLQNHIKQ